jgi:hypothetical protein
MFYNKLNLDQIIATGCERLIVLDQLKEMRKVLPLEILSKLFLHQDFI